MATRPLNMPQEKICKYDICMRKPRIPLASSSYRKRRVRTGQSVGREGSTEVLMVTGRIRRPFPEPNEELIQHLE